MSSRAPVTATSTSEMERGPTRSERRRVTDASLAPPPPVMLGIGLVARLNVDARSGEMAVVEAPVSRAKQSGPLSLTKASIRTRGFAARANRNRNADWVAASGALEAPDRVIACFA